MFIIPFSGDLLGDSRMSNVLDKSFIHRSYPKLAYGSMYVKDVLDFVWGNVYVALKLFPKDVRTKTFKYK